MVQTFTPFYFYTCIDFFSPSQKSGSFIFIPRTRITTQQDNIFRCFITVIFSKFNHPPTKSSPNLKSNLSLLSPRPSTDPPSFLTPADVKIWGSIGDPQDRWTRGSFFLPSRHPITSSLVNTSIPWILQDYGPRRIGILERPGTVMYLLFHFP